MPPITHNENARAMKSIVVTSINSPNEILRALAGGSASSGFDFIVIGDTKSPVDFSLADCRFLSVADQLKTKLQFAQACPVRHYARKNIGYLLAISKGTELIVETDDDNFPRAEFFEQRNRSVTSPVVRGVGWLNVYRYFSDVTIWPRGLPLDRIHADRPPFENLPVEPVHCPIQQGLADKNPDVDAIYRLALPLPQNFRSDRRIALGKGAWCPFNSQNTAWWPEAFPLLYLPAYCSFRMTDIWRSFVAQRIAWENGWHLLFHKATVWQERNEHNLMRDFADEVPGYLHNEKIRGTLEDLPLSGGVDNISANLRRCYEALVRIEVIGEAELPLLDAWLSDLDSLSRTTRA